MPRYRIDPHVEDDQTDHMRALLERHGWESTLGDDWHFSWSDELHPLEVFASLTEGQKVNHFPGIGSIVFKDALHDFLAVAAQRLEGTEERFHYDFFPQVFSMPDHYEEFLDVAASDPRRLWMVKPKALSLGRGVRVLGEPRSVPRGEEWMVQEYIADPLLLRGLPFKHVLRVYLLVTSLEPLVLHLFPNGVVKFAGRPFSLGAESFGDRRIHVTDGQRFESPGAYPVPMWDLDTYRARLREGGLDATRLWERIRRMLILTVVAHREPILELSLERTERLDCCFELLGCDVLVDSALRPWLLECNMSPGLDCDLRTRLQENPRRRAIEPMVADMLRLAGLTPGQEELPARNGARPCSEEAAPRTFELLFPSDDAGDYRPCFERIRPGDPLSRLDGSLASGEAPRHLPER